jgi:hypothetical protein
MLDPKSISDMAKRLMDALPDTWRQGGEEVERQFKTIIQHSLVKMDVVTREEFDVQAKVLLRTREKLEQLERKMAELEANKK